MRLIDPLELKRSISASVLCGDGKHIFDIIDEQPTIEERKKGKWKQIKGRDGYIDFRCSACHKYRFHNGAMRKEYKFCPSCGADMREEV